MPFVTWQATAQSTPDAGSIQAALVRLGASVPAQDLTHWIVRSFDHKGLPFVVVDKREARVFVFDRDGRMLGTAPALLGLAIGDDGFADTGDRTLAQIKPEERTTPAGRYLAQLDRNSLGQTIMWVDYEQAISMHPVRSLNPREQRLERLASPSVHDNRISYGCINVPVRFWRSVVLPTFRDTTGVVYVLPEVQALESVFIGLKVQKEAAVK
jgi:hypothetical protein